MALKFFNTFKRGDGFVTQEWTATEMFDYELIKYVFIGVLVSFVSVILSGVLLVIRLFDYNNDEKAPSFIGIGASLYFLIDYYNGWFVTWLMKMLGYGYNLKAMAIWNLTMLLAHILLLVIGDTIYFNTEEPQRQKTIFIYAGFAVVVLYNISKCLI